MQSGAELRTAVERLRAAARRRDAVEPGEPPLAAGALQARLDSLGQLLQQQNTALVALADHVERLAERPAPSAAASNGTAAARRGRRATGPILVVLAMIATFALGIWQGERARVMLNAALMELGTLFETR
jgi:hypothetical protein